MSNPYTAYIEDEILSASPLRLVCLLYEKAISELRSARTYMLSGDVAPRCAAITKACDVIAELSGSLDLTAGGETADRLYGLYQYSLSRLLEANLQKQEAPIAEVIGLLHTLLEGWAQIDRTPAPVPATMPSPAVYAAYAGESAAQTWSF